MFGHSGHNGGTVLVRLRAVAMERDDNSEGWVPIGAGGLSNVCVIKRTLSVPNAPTATSTSSLPGAPTGGGGAANGLTLDARLSNNNNTTTVNNLNGNGVNRSEFVIYAHRLIDDELVFKCAICKDFEYNKVMPTFHNWKTGGKRVGLIFQTAADGRVFDRGIMGVLLELSVGLELIPPQLNLTENDNEVFMAVELPYKWDGKQQKKNEVGSRHVSPTSTDSSSQKGTSSLSDTEPPKVYRQKQHSPKEPFLYHSQQPPPPPSLLTSVVASTVPPHQLRLTENVKSRYALPPTSLSPLPPPSSATPLTNLLDSPETFKKQRCFADAEDLSASLKIEKPRSLICRHCRKNYLQEENVKGACEYAPDCVKTSIDRVTCIPCARTMVYHCMSDAEGNFAQQPCECDGNDSGCAKRWLGLAILSILLPCLWCYPPLKVCHLCGVSCGACGGKHEPINTPSTPATS